MLRVQVAVVCSSDDKKQDLLLGVLATQPIEQQVFRLTENEKPMRPKEENLEDKMK